MRKTISLTLLLALAAMIVGCGSSSDADADAPKGAPKLQADPKQAGANDQPGGAGVATPQ